MFFCNQEHTPDEPETLFHLFFTLTFLLHYYSNAFFALLISLCVDLAWLATAIITQLVDWVVDSACDLVSEGVRALRCRPHRERPAEAIAHRGPAIVLWLLFLGVDLLIDWSSLGGGFFMHLPLPLLLAQALLTPIGAWLAVRLAFLQDGDWQTARLLAEVEQLYAETRAETAQLYQEIEQCACEGEE